MTYTKEINPNGFTNAFGYFTHTLRNGKEKVDWDTFLIILPSTNDEKLIRRYERNGFYKFNGQSFSGFTAGTKDTYNPNSIYVKSYKLPVIVSLLEDAEKYMEKFNLNSVMVYAVTDTEKLYLITREDTEEENN